MVLISAASFLVAGCERSFIYYPDNPARASLDRTAASFGLAPWTADGERIGWVARQPGDGQRVAIVVFHGNAGHAADRVYYVRGLQQAGGQRLSDVYLFEYPGYGNRSGRPSEETILAAATEALDSLAADSYQSLYLVGESLGGGIASHLAAVRPDRVSGLLLVTPFTSLEDVARRHFPGFLVRLLLTERYDNATALAAYDGRLAVIIAANDEVVPAELGQRLYDGYRGEKRLWIQEGRSHNTLNIDSGAAWWAEVLEFLEGA